LLNYEKLLGVNTTAPDNSNANKSDMGLTPLDQGSSDADINRTKAIRKALTDSDLSFDAKNIKIITLNDNVTLRGIVKNAEERELIVKIAVEHSSTDQVHDQLKIAPNQ
jgi:hyperosmotically inducible protein